MLFSSNIPYYVGPVGSGSKTGWANIKESGQVLPWNMEQKIDIEQTSERFITNLIPGMYVPFRRKSLAKAVFII